MLEAQKGEVGLGPVVGGSERTFRFGHGGANEGFRSELVIYPELGVGAAIMTNSDGGALLIREVLRALAAEYAWPDYGVEQVPAVALGAATSAGLIGTYRLGPDPTVHAYVQQDGDGLVLRLPELPEQELVPKSGTSFVMSPLGWHATFMLDSSGRATGISIRRWKGEPIDAARTN